METTPATFAGASPNPSDGNITLRFSLPARAEADLSIHDLTARLLRRAVVGVRGAGPHVATWDGRDGKRRDVATGVYFARLVVRGDTGQEVSMREIGVAR